eukprot:snap_masked-scaffold_53-processed-gene-0.14-mRNA-1 protein AED:1.00 eAED:1.00 QI:0/-1/0/0/-1/1/1/0/99
MALNPAVIVIVTLFGIYLFVFNSCLCYHSIYELCSKKPTKAQVPETEVDDVEDGLPKPVTDEESDLEKGEENIKPYKGNLDMTSEGGSGAGAGVPAQAP